MLWPNHDDPYDATGYPYFFYADGTEMPYDEAMRRVYAFDELIQAASRIHALNHTQGVTDEEFEAADQRLDELLAKYGDKA